MPNPSALPFPIRAYGATHLYALLQYFDASNTFRHRVARARLAGRIGRADHRDVDRVHDAILIELLEGVVLVDDGVAVEIQRRPAVVHTQRIRAVHARGFAWIRVVLGGRVG